MISYTMYNMINSFNPTHCNDPRGLMLELPRHVLVGGGEVFKVLSHPFCNGQMQSNLMRNEILMSLTLKSVFGELGRDPDTSLDPNLGGSGFAKKPRLVESGT